MNGRFGWNNNKAASNWRDHGITFDQAAKATGDPFAVEWIDDREAYGEERINLLGMCDGVILHVTYTERGERIWYFSPAGDTTGARQLLPREFDPTAPLSRCSTTAPNGRFRKRRCAR